MSFFIFLRILIGVKATYNFLTKILTNAETLHEYMLNEIGDTIFIGYILVTFTEVLLLAAISYWGLTPILKM